MSLAARWTLNQIRSAVRRELLDPTGKWWSNDELNQYINDWQQNLQNQFEFVWATSTLTFTDTTTTFDISTVTPGAMRLDAVYYCAGGTDTSTGRLSPRSPADLDTMQRDWRGTAAAAGINPVIVYQNNAQTVSFWPPPAGTGTVYFEYPVLCTMTTTVSSGTFVDGTMAIPAWTRYSAIPYCRYRAYSRFGPNQDINKASRARKAWDRQKKLIRRFWDGYFPDKSERLRPGRKWAGQVLRTKPAWPIWR